MIPLFALISGAMLIAILKAAFGLGFVIFVHELGHFLVAKACGVKCEKFYVGFDVPIKIGPIQLPRALFRAKWGETEYGIGIIPLGGYVKMLGQDDNPANSAKEAERIRQARESGDGSGDAELEIDPRSYPAKTVPQRLMIISAGVIMNLIFAVIFGMIAYRMGVSYTPCIVGSTSPGLSAWDVGLGTGDRIIQMGRDGKMSEHLRFDKDMMVKVMMTGPNQKLDLLVQRYSPEGATPSEPEWIQVQLSNPQEELHGRPIIGISRYATPTIGLADEVKKVLAHLPAIQAQPELQVGDKIVAFDGAPVNDYVELSRLLAQSVDDTIELTVERPAEDQQDSENPTNESINVRIPPNPARWLGMEMTMGPIVAIQNGSVAEQSGFQIGDRVLELNGEPIGDPLTLPGQLRRQAGQETTVTVQRKGEPVQLTVTPREPQMLQAGVGLGKPLGADAIGIAFSIENTVAAIQPGSPAAEAGLQPGDQLQEVGFVPTTPESTANEQRLFGPAEPLALGENNLSWPAVHDRIQLSAPTTRVRVQYLRDGLQSEVEMDTTVSEAWFVADRGVKLTIREEVHRVHDWGEAFWLGVRETGESISQVYFILFRLVTGQISPTNLGGPASIATMAGLEASESTARLLIFLTLLSANLAVINFLPIPVLDGGHATFLLYEGIFRRPVNDRIAFGLTMAGFCFILGLMIFVIGLDVWRLSGMAS